MSLLSKKNVIQFAILWGLLSCSSQKPVDTVDSVDTTDTQRDVAARGGLEKWSYDAGPDPKTKMGKELIDLYAEIPNFPEMSEALLGKQKFRPVYGPIPWRMQQKPNSVKILFIGQDGTHIAEAAGRPATAGFGGRAQDLAKYFGVGPSAAFINAYAFTIKGQYGAFETPFVKGGKVQYGGFVDNPLWLLSQDQESALVQWRNELISWIIRNNKDSLKMIVLFGGAARDAAASFIESRGGKVGTRFSDEEIADIQVPETELVSAGGNNEMPYPLTPEGEDLYAKVLGRRVQYKGTMEEKKSSDVTAAQEALADKYDRWKKEMVFSEGGPFKNGMIHPAQLGGYDIDNKMQISERGRPTISLKGLRISSDVTLSHDVLVVQLPHPTALSMMKPAAAADAVAKDLAGFKPYLRSWKIEPDPGFTNSFAAGRKYEYGRAGMGPEYYDFGAPASRMVAVSTAARAGENVIVFGTRDKGGFDDSKTKALIAQMTKARPSKMPAAAEMWTMRPRTSSARYIFDPGPGEKYAKIMKENIPEELLEKHATNRDYAHYRGTFNSPRIVVLADPEGYDDLITARALTGSRGQFLHGLMEDFRVGDKYLVIKTAPFGEEDERDWDEILAKTARYREELLGEILRDGTPQAILADGPSAAREIRRILGDRAPCPVIAIKRGESKDAGLREAATELRKEVSAFKGARYMGKMSDIPRSHLSYYARIWEGTSGDRVITSPDKEFKGTAFAEVAPEWAYEQRTSLSPNDRKSVQTLLKRLETTGLRKGGEKIPTFLRRKERHGALDLQLLYRALAA